MAFGSNGGAYTGRILIVGEDTSAFMTLTSWLEGRGIPSEVASWASLASYRMVPEAYDVIIVDLRASQTDWLSRLGRVAPASTILLHGREMEQIATGNHPPEDFLYVPMPAGRTRFLSVVLHALACRRLERDIQEARVALDGRRLWEIEREVVEKTIRQCSGSIPSAARRLGVSPSTLYRKREAWSKRERGMARKVAY